MFLSPCVPEFAAQQNSNKRSIYKKCSPQKAAFFNSITHRKLLISFQFQTISCYKTIRLQNFKRHTQQLLLFGKAAKNCYRTIRLQNFKDIHNFICMKFAVCTVVIELLDYKISKTYTTPCCGYALRRVVVIELLDYKISKTYTTFHIVHTRVPQLLQNYQITKFQRHTQLALDDVFEEHNCYRTIRLQNFKDKEGLFQKDAAKVLLFFEICK